MHYISLAYQHVQHPLSHTYGPGTEDEFFLDSHTTKKIGDIAYAVGLFTAGFGGVVVYFILAAFYKILHLRQLNNHPPSVSNAHEVFHAHYPPQNGIQGLEENAASEEKVSTPLVEEQDEIPNDGICHLQSLPPEVIVYAFSWLNSNDLGNLARVSQEVSNYAKDDWLWKSLYKRELDLDPMETTGKSWKEIYKEEASKTYPCVVQNMRANKTSLNYRKKTKVKDLKNLYCDALKISRNEATCFTFFKDGRIMKDEDLSSSHMQTGQIINTTRKPPLSQPT